MDFERISAGDACFCHAVTMRRFSSRPSFIAVAIIGVIAFIGGGVADAATSSTTIKVCVTSKNVVRSADAKGKCPKRTKAVAVNKVGPVGAAGRQGVPGPAGAVGGPGPAGAPGVAGKDAATRVIGSDAPSASSYPAFTRVSSPEPDGTPLTSFQVAKVLFDAPKAGFYSVAVSSVVSGDHWGDDPPPELGCSEYASNYPEGGAQIWADGRKVGTISSSDSSFTDSRWLEAGHHSFELRLVQNPCLTNDSYGIYSFNSTHMQVYAD